MSKLLVAIIGFVYLYIGIEQYIKGNNGTAFMFSGYALANVGAYMTVT